MMLTGVFGRHHPFRAGMELPVVQRNDAPRVHPAVGAGRRQPVQALPRTVPRPGEVLVEYP